MTAVPNFARMNRTGPPREFLDDPTVNYAPGAITSTTPATTNLETATSTAPARRRSQKPESKVWI